MAITIASSLSLLVPLCASPASAQEVRSDISRVLARIDALEKRIRALEEERQEVTAPFRIVESGGRRTILTVDSDGSGGVALVVGDGAGSNVTISANRNGGEVEIGSGSITLAALTGRPGETAVVLKDQSTASSLTASGAQAGLTVKKGETATVRIVSGADGGSIETADDNGQPNASLTGRGAYLYDNQGKTYFEAGFASDTNKPILVVGDRATNARVEIGAGTGGDGSYVWLFDGQRRDARVNILANSRGAQLAVANAEGRPAFFAGTSPLTEGKARLVVGSTAGARLEGGELKDGSGSYFSLYNASGGELASLTVNNTESRFELDASDQKNIFSVASSGAGGAPRLVLGDDEKARVVLGLTKDGSGSYFSLHNASGGELASLTVNNTESRFELDASDQKNIFSVASSGAGGAPRLVLGGDEKARVELGLTRSLSGSYLSLFDQANKDLISMTGITEAPNLTIVHGDTSAVMGASSEAEKMNGFFLLSDNATLVSIRASEDGGRLVAGNPQGAPTAGLYSTKDGGQVLVAGPQGTKTQVGINGSATGGQISVKDASGETRVFLEGQENGKVQVTGPGGFIHMKGGQTAPSVQIMDGAGTVMVQAGIGASNHVGVVQTGPAGNGVAAALTGGRAASSINGKPD